MGSLPVARGLARGGASNSLGQQARGKIISVARHPPSMLGSRYEASACPQDAANDAQNGGHV